MMHQVLYIVQLPNEEGDMHISGQAHYHCAKGEAASGR